MRSILTWFHNVNARCKVCGLSQKYSRLYGAAWARLTVTTRNGSSILRRAVQAVVVVQL